MSQIHTRFIENLSAQAPLAYDPMSGVMSISAPLEVKGGTTGATIGNFNDRLKVSTTFDHAPQVDAFERLRVSEPFILLDSVQKYDKVPLVWCEKITGGATSVHDPNISSTRMTVSASGDKVIRQTRRYVVYMPGRSQLILMTGTMGPKRTGVRQRLGYFDGENGVFYEQTADGIYLVLRSKSSGVVTENRVHQSQWNQNKLDGTVTVDNPDGINLDLSKSMIFKFSLAWLGVGTVRCGLIINGRTYATHFFHHANISEVPYMSTGKLPCRYEIEATGTPSAPTTLIHTCAAVMSEGGGLSDGIVKSVSNGITKRSLAGTNRTPLVSVRLGSSYVRAAIKPLKYEILVSSADDVYYELVYNGTLTGASWSADGMVDVDRVASSVSGGHVIQSGYIKNGSGFSSGVIPENVLWVSADIDGVSDTISVVVTNFTGGNASASASLNFREVV